jgi:predicted transcriptional regulator
MSASNAFHDLLFELSNENRYEILVFLRKKAMRISDITREVMLKTPEARRHISRLVEIGLIQRDIEGYYHLTHYGETVLISLNEFIFLSNHKDYLTSHNLNGIPTRFLKRISEIDVSKKVESVIDFLRFSESLFRESNEYVWLLVDQFPLNSLSTIVDAIERGVQFKIIEPKDRTYSPDLDSMTTEEFKALRLTNIAPSVEQKILREVQVFLFLSELKCIIAFPNSDGRFDYTGFMSIDKSSLNWCNELFQYYWEKAELKKLTPQKIYKQPPPSEQETKTIIVEGRNDPNIDTISIQNALDNYDEVILRGRFNLGRGNISAALTGSTCIKIRKSVKIRGEGRENNIPLTKVVKSNWSFPFLEFEYLFEVDGEGIDVTIENIHFQDFNGDCITASRGNSVIIRENRITLNTGLGRGQTFGHMGDRVTGITVWGPDRFNRANKFPGGVVIEGNYLDFALAYSRGGYIDRKKLTNPNYRPEHEKHETYIGTGILLNNQTGKVVIRDNIIRNMNAKGIVIQDNYESSEIQIIGNTIVSEVYGSYAFSTHIAGYGIQCLSAWGNPRSGSKIEIYNNHIRCAKLNYYGIAIYGQSIYQNGAGKLGKCIVRDNHIHLGDGHVCVLIRKNDYTEIVNNKISGSAYYGIHLWGSKDRDNFDLSSSNNIVKDNDLTELVIKAQDEYSNNHVNGRMFTGSEGNSTTSHYWINKFSSKNKLYIRENEFYINEGKDNEIIIV